MGISLDGDADRIIMCDEKGSIIDGDQIIAALALQWKKRKILKGGVVGTLMSNYGLEKFLKEKGIKFLRANVGDRYVKELMQKKKFNLDDKILKSHSVKRSIKIAEKLIKNQGRILVRKSGTEPKIRIMGESENKILLKKCINMISKEFK